MERKKQSRKAFTLVELLVVIVIISMLGAFVAPKVFKSIGKSKRDLARPRLALVEGALERFAIDCGRYPDDSEGLEVLIMPPDDETLEGKWDGPYCKRSHLLDPWDTPIVYQAEGEFNMGSYDLISLGADKAEGGEGDAEDIINE
ncbi:MAG: type II secretion system major pseudopilin GspG [Planctomycetota bacterium]|jgi:general secretion pathway protein G